MTLYWVQTRAPAHNWVDNLGTSEKASAISHAIYLRKRGEAVRVVVRVHRVVWPEGR
ncbi:MAG: hypothetical protein KGI89_03125 [Euryarchaeota archaeon]|nr:hypothetical protein [Euryarchaeota archaeon]